MMELKSLRQLHSEAGGTAFKAQSANGSVAVIIGIARLKNEKEERAYGYLLETSRAPARISYKSPIEKDHLDNMKTFDADRLHWKPWVEPKPVPHWPALRKVQRTTREGGIGLSTVLYSTEEEARLGLKDNFIRLLKEYPPVDLIPCGAIVTEDNDEFE